MQELIERYIKLLLEQAHVANDFISNFNVLLKIKRKFPNEMTFLSYKDYINNFPFKVLNDSPKIRAAVIDRYKQNKGFRNVVNNSVLYTKETKENRHIRFVSVAAFNEKHLRHSLRVSERDYIVVSSVAFKAHNLTRTRKISTQVLSSIVDIVDSVEELITMCALQSENINE